MAEKRRGLTYAQAGVDIDAGNRMVELIKPLVRATARPGADSEIGGFGGIFDLKQAGYRDPVLVAATDGVGTKLKVAVETGRHDTIGGGNQNRVAIAYPLEVEKPAKAPNLCFCARAGGGPNQWLDQFDHSVASVDINTGLRVSESARFFCHSGSSSAPGRTLESQVAQWSERRYTPPKELACFRRLWPDRVVEPGST